MAARERGVAGVPAGGAAGRAERAAAHDRGGGRARQDDDRGDDRARAARRGVPTPAGSWGPPSEGNCRTRTGQQGEWLVIEADESDRSMFSLEMEIAVLTNVELDHHATYRARWSSCVRPSASSWTGPAWAVVWDRPELLELRAGPVAPYEVSDLTLTPGGSRFGWQGREVTLAVPGAHNARNATGALEAVRLTGADPAGAIAGLAGFHGAGRRFQLSRARARRVRVCMTTTPTTRPRWRRRCARRARSSTGGWWRCSSRTCTRARPRSRGSSGARWRCADAVVVLDVYPARERAEEHPGVSGLLIAQEAADAADGRRCTGCPRFADAGARAAGHAGRG